MKIGELVRRSGLSAHTLRYYERIGLLPRPLRDASRQRDYDPSILAWIAFLRRLKTTAMPLKDMLRYARLRERGLSTEPDRKKLLEAHRSAVSAHVKELQACLKILDAKIAGYSAAKTGKEKHDTRKHAL
jgi:DNA-binding transcriptional MerR regulator